MFSYSTYTGYLILSWILYFSIHSVLASIGLKRFVQDKLPNFMPYYRLVFNIVAIVLLVPCLWLTYANPSPVLWQWYGWVAWLANGLALLAVIGFIATLRHYDGQTFLGLQQIRDKTRSINDEEKFHISPIHRFVRHPWYSFALVIIWTRDMTSSFLITSIVLTIYFIIGARLEERKLLSYYGDSYKRFMGQVPGLVPLPWRYLSKQQAQAIVEGRFNNNT